MKTLLLSISILLIGISSINAQAISDSISLQTSYADQVFYQLSSGTKTASNTQDWDLQFFSSLFSASIRINGGFDAELYEPSNSDTTNFTSTTIDTVGANLLRDGNDDWQNDVFTSTATGHPDYGWGVYQGTGLLVGKKVFIIKTTSGIWKKIWIKTISPSGPVTFVIANLDGSSSVTKTYNRTTYSSKHHFYYDIDNDSLLDAEPLKADWELVFRKYSESLGALGYYNVVGGFSNYNTGIAEVRGVEVNTAQANWNSYSFDSSLNVLGHDWKSFNNSTFMWELEDSLSYFIKDNNEDVYQVVFTGFGGSATGMIYFTKELLSAASIDESSPFVNFGIYPNPTHSVLNITYELKDARALSFSIFDVNGKIVKSFNGNSGVEGFNEGAISVEDLNSGIYFLRTETNNYSITKRFIKN